MLWYLFLPRRYYSQLQQGSTIEREDKRLMKGHSLCKVTFANNKQVWYGGCFHKCDRPGDII